MKPVRYTILALLLCPALSAHGADNVPDAARTVSERVVEPSPDVATARRYADFPVSYATGSASVSLPLMTLSTPSLSVSLGLDYRCEAKKVDEPAGWVGLGWTLTGLGTVSRQICGMPDDKEKDFFYLPEGKGGFNKEYFDDLILLKKDANYDRYTIVTPDGEAASFIVDDGSVKMLSVTELEVWFDHAGENTYSPEVFHARTPDGACYEYAQKERLSYKYHSATNYFGFVFPEYETVSAWHLTKIIDAAHRDSVTIEYTDGTPWQAIHGSTSVGAMSYTREMCGGGYHGVSGSGGDDSDLGNDGQPGNSGGHEVVNPGNGGYHKDPNPSADGRLRSSPAVGSASYGVTSYSPVLPRSVTARTGSIVFDFESTPPDPGDSRNGTADRLRAVRLLAPDGGVAAFAEFAESELQDGRRTLHELRLGGNGGMNEGYAFAYNESWAWRSKDLFGYPNGREAVGNWESVLGDTHLRLAKARRTDPNHLHDGLLRQMTGSTGITTEFAYEPSVISLPDTSYLFGTEVVTGTRIKSITATDNVTGRCRIRRFSYHGPMLTACVDSLWVSAFLAPSGTVTKCSQGMATYYRYDMDVVFTGSARLPGKPVENTRIVYGSVEEYVTDPDSACLSMTRYEYDLSHCRTPSLHCGRGAAGNAPDGVRELGFDSFPETAMAQLLFGVFNSQRIGMYFQEVLGAEPLLTKKTTYAWTGTGYRPRTTETRTYSVAGSRTARVGLYYDHAAFRKAGTAYIDDKVVSEAHVDYGEISVRAKRTVCTGIKVTRHFDNGHTRTTAIDYQYFPTTNMIPEIPDPDKFYPLNPRHPGFAGDSLKVNKLNGYYRPLAASYSNGDESLTRYDLYPCHINSGFFKGHPERYLPVARKWVACGPGYRDSLETAWLYGKFHGMTRAVRETVSRHGAVLDMAAYTAYDALGLPTAMTRRDGSEYAMTWDGYGNLTSRELVGPGLESRYTYKPLVGCTSITYPSGRRKYFSYDNGRLSQVRNTANEPVASYGYTMANPGLNWGAQGENAVTTTVYTASGQAVSRAVYDGFGMKTADIVTLDGADVVTATDYDALDRAVKLWQPLPSGQTAQSYYGDAEAFTLNAYDTDGSERVVASTAPGSDMSGHPATNEYLCNTQSGELRCRHFVLEGDRLTDRGAYADAALDVVRATDADGHRVLTFTDWRGRTVLVRKVLGDSKYIDTHTLYDAWGDVLLVLQPEGTAAMQAGGSWDVSDGSMDDVIEKYAYVYRYDDALRPVYAKLPGVDPVTTAYDPDGLAAYTVDGNLRAKGRARFTLYDSASRPVVTGICDEPTGEVPRMRASFSSSDPGLDSTYYSTGVPLSGAEVYTATYYDGYGFVSLPPFAAIPAVQMPTATAAAGLVTATLDRVMDGGTDPRRAKYVATVNTYDAEERPIKTVTAYHDTGICAVSENSYNIDGTVSTCTNTLLHPYDGHNDSHVYSYDAAGRLLKETVSYDGGEPVTVQQLNYNAIGQLSANDLGAFTEVYTYDVRGAMTKRKSDVFEQNILFTGKFNGSIASINDNLADGLSMTSWYTYDKAGRLTKANMKVGGTPRCVDYTYDLNGNITSLVRDGDDGIDPIAWIDNLTYTYDGNKVRKITDTNGDVISERTMDFPDKADLDVEYGYDRNGNMTWDANRGVHMQWDANNRLDCAYYNPGVLSFTRSATGRRLSRSYSPNQSVALVGGTIKKGRSYADFPSFGGFDRPGQTGFPIIDTYDTYGAYEYENGKFSRLNTATGYRDSLGVHVYVRDWQGNIRAVVRKGADGKAVLEQATYYYPYGMPMAESTNPTINKYKYTGKELLTDHGVNILDYGPRPYDPTTGIWWSVDAMSHKTPDYSHYVFCNADPINHIDPSGKIVETIWDIANVIYDVGAAIYCHIEGDHETAQTHWVDAVVDTGSALIPGVPAGASKAARMSAEVVESSVKAANRAEIATEVSVRAVNKVEDAATATKAVHGNSKASTKAQHVYIIRDKKTGEVVKVGISGGPKTHNGTRSSRATSQVNKWNKEAGYERYEAEIIEDIPAGPNARDNALTKEKDYAKSFIDQGQLNNLEKHQRPRP